MLKKTLPAIEFATLAITVFLMAANVAEGASSPSVALTGQVSSHEAGRIRVVLASGKRDGSTVTTTVVSDAQGKYSFPTAELDPGRYGLPIRAVAVSWTARGRSESAEYDAARSQAR